MYMAHISGSELEILIMQSSGIQLSKSKLSTSPMSDSALRKRRRKQGHRHATSSRKIYTTAIQGHCTTTLSACSSKQGARNCHVGSLRCVASLRLLQLL